MKIKLTSDEIKQVELDILIEFNDFCNKNGLSYCLCGGTLLGAVRHKGFIPWDDDIDVIVPRGDFEKILAISENQRDDLKYRFISWKTGDSPYPFIKMIDTTTEVKEEYINPKYKIGVWIDIFPYDGMPLDDSLVRKKYNKLKRKKMLLLAITSESNKGTTWYFKAIKSVVVPFIKKMNIEKICDQMNDISSEYSIETSPYVGGFLWGYGPRERMSKSFMNTIDMEFEGHMFNAPENWDEYLTGLYGGYMQLPPEDKRIHHYFDAYRIISE